MPEYRIEEVARQLLAQSMKDKVVWEDAGKRGSYRVFFPDGVLAISEVYPGLEDSNLQFELMNETGRVVDSMETAPEDSMHSLLKQIFNLARQHVRDIAITNALEFLKGT